MRKKCCQPKCTEFSNIEVSPAHMFMGTKYISRCNYSMFHSMFTFIRLRLQQLNILSVFFHLLTADFATTLLVPTKTVHEGSLDQKDWTAEINL